MKTSDCHNTNVQCLASQNVVCTGFRGASAQRQREGLIVVGRANQRVLGGRDGHIQNLMKENQ
jgi:hypothetical protein